MLLVAAGCAWGKPGKERMGDDAWHAGRWTEAVADYAAAGSSPTLLAKLADASLQAGDLTGSAKAWVQLATDAPQRAGEAAAGLARVADAAAEGGNQAALAAAVVGLRQVAPGWPLGRLAARLGVPVGLQPFEAGEIIPALLAASPPREQVDPMVLALARADRSLGACPLAVPMLDGVLRRSTDTVLRDSVSAVAATCELSLGLAALDGGHLGEAELWLNRATGRAPDTPIGRRAMVGFGTARLREGDSVTARSAWEAVATSPAPADTITQLALQHLQQLAPVMAGDSGILTPGRP
ncbi:MAG TPA: hypothetical protein VGM77_11660 [Gemmatimonadales bacterium]